MIHKKALGISFALLSALAPAFALAASDDNVIWNQYFGSANVVNAEANTLYVVLNGNYASISTADDVDYHVVMCHGGKIRSAGISFTNSKGDLDIKVYDVDGNSLGSSTGKSNGESVNISNKGLTVAVMKVYGYADAINGYDPSISCE